MLRANSVLHGCLLFIVLTFGARLAPAQDGNKTPARSVSSSKSETTPDSAKTVPSVSNGRTLKLDRTLSFSLTLDIDRKPKIEFRGLDNQGIAIESTDSEKVSQLLTVALKNSKNLDGVVIRVAKNVKYPLVNSLFKNIQSSLTKNDVDLPVFVAIKDPRKTVSQDEIVTKEFVLKSVDASKVYNRVLPVGKQLGIEVRIDPKRNSITVKGAAKFVAGIQSIVTKLDSQTADSADNEGAVNRPNIIEQTTPRKATGDNQSAPRTGIGGSNVQPINNTPVQTGSRQPAVGKYQMSSVGNNLFLLDTATGDSWFLNTGGEKMFWSKLPHPSDQ